MRLVFFTLTGLIVRFNWRFPIGTHRSTASHACNRAADHFIVQPCPYAVGVVIDRAVFTNTEVLRRLDGVNISAEEQEFPTILALLMLNHLLRDAQDQTRIALEVEEVVYDPKDNKLFLYTTSETCYAVSKVVRANADSIIEELVMKGYSDLTQFESEQDE